ncbi:MAG: serine--tRNA ligase [Patescibacteria group bacterium]|nr:serine--tRNA ligase [Patescibacteria group bacterium]MDD5121758.1 serine--tRNA ligase [Patescibacteria group bacterium]
MDLKFIRQNKDLITDGCRKKRIKVDIDKIIKLDEERRLAMQKIESFRAEQNKMGKKPSTEEINKLKQIKTETKKLEEQLKKTESELNNLVRMVPNMPLPEVPVGQSEDDNVVLREVGKKPQFNFIPKDYLVLNEKLDLIDTERAAKVAGSRFGYLKNEAVLLEFGLMQLALEVIVKKGFIPVLPPVMVNEKAMSAMGYLDRTGDEIYKTQDDLYLVGTSEQSIGPMHMDEIFAANLPARELPKRYISFSTCFRREAGSYGKDVKGIIRVHQFDKMEMFVFCRPEDSRSEHQLLLSLEEELMKLLKIPYRVLNICTADLGDPAAAKYDLEAWMPGQNENKGQYRETHSTSNCTDFQSQRLNVRYRDKDGKTNLVHTLNGTVFSQRPIIAIMENYQQKDGSIVVPKVLQKYIKIKKIKPRI